MAHHPENSSTATCCGADASTVHSFVRSLWGTRINAGVWGTAAFPSVYRADVHPFAFMPHSIRWQVVSFVMTLAGLAVVATGQHWWAAALLLGSGVIGLAVTIGKNIAYALRSDVNSLEGWKLWYRGMVAYLHFLQPLARLRGQIRGVLSPPEVALPPEERQTKRGAGPSVCRAWRALLLVSGSVTETGSGAKPGRRPIASWPGSPTGCAGLARCARSKSTRGGRTTGT
jgi:hypothetical protein